MEKLHKLGNDIEVAGGKQTITGLESLKNISKQPFSSRRFIAG